LKDSEGEKCDTTQAKCKQQQSLKKMNEATPGSGGAKHSITVFSIALSIV
jgi:hypothetical protein